jgi:hypothetical protein
MEEYTYSGKLKEILFVKNTDKESIRTNSQYGSMIVEGRLELISHQGKESVTQTRIVIGTNEGDKMLDFLGRVPKSYVGKRILVKTSYNSKTNMEGGTIEFRHSITAGTRHLNGVLKFNYVPEIGFFGKGEILFEKAGGRMKR